MIFPIRGKIKNAFKCSRDSFFSNEEVQGITRIILGKEGYHRNFNVEDCKVDRVIFMADADFDGNHIAALLLRMFVMYFPQMIAAGMVYKAIPPLYSIKQGKKNKYFIDQIDIVRYIQKAFLEKYKFEPIKGTLDSKAITTFFIKNSDYIYYLEDAANTYAVNPYLLELALFDYIENKGKFDYEKIKKKVTSMYRFMNVSKSKDAILISGTIDESNSLILGERLINDCTTILDLMRANDAFYYKIDGTVMSLYDIMKLYDKVSPSGIQRYKGLGEMPKEDLAESTLLPENRTLIQYTLEDAKEELELIREYESDSKKILNLVGKVTRDDLLE